MEPVAELAPLVAAGYQSAVGAGGYLRRGTPLPAGRYIHNVALDDIENLGPLPTRRNLRPHQLAIRRPRQTNLDPPGSLVRKQPVPALVRRRTGHPVGNLLRSASQTRRRTGRRRTVIRHVLTALPNLNLRQPAGISAPLGNLHADNVELPGRNVDAGERVLVALPGDRDLVGPPHRLARLEQNDIALHRTAGVLTPVVSVPDDDAAYIRPRPPSRNSPSRDRLDIHPDRRQSPRRIRIVRRKCVNRLENPNRFAQPPHRRHPRAENLQILHSRLLGDVNVLRPRRPRRRKRLFVALVSRVNPVGVFLVGLLDGRILPVQYALHVVCGVRRRRGRSRLCLTLRRANRRQNRQDHHSRQRCPPPDSCGFP